MEPRDGPIPIGKRPSFRRNFHPTTDCISTRRNSIPFRHQGEPFVLRIRKSCWSREELDQIVPRDRANRGSDGGSSFSIAAVVWFGHPEIKTNSWERCRRIILTLSNSGIPLDFARRSTTFCERPTRHCALWELKGKLSPFEITADFVYVRLHGPQAKTYRGSYPDRILRKWRDRVWAWKRARKDVLSISIMTKRVMRLSMHSAWTR